MQRTTETREKTHYEMSSFNGTHPFKEADIALQSSGNGSSEITDADKTGAYRKEEEAYEEGVYEVIANETEIAPNDEMKSERAPLPEAATYDSVVTITQAMHQQMALFRRMVYLMSVVLLMVFLTAVACLVLTALMTTGKISCLNQTTSLPGTYPFPKK